MAGIQVRIIHKSSDEGSKHEKQSLIEDAKILAGKEAGICYMADDYFSDKINDIDSALKRADGIIKSGHHSPFDHYSIGLEISNIPKILVMILNSTEMYTTSEKSARYTVMTPDSDLELTIYNKWRSIFEDLISNRYPNIDSKTRSKLSLENARYMISVFTPTSMGYTTSFRQLNYMVDYLKQLIINLNNNKTSFNSRLIPHCEDLMKSFKEITKEIIPNNKHRYFEFLRLQNGFDTWDGTEYMYDSYCVSYNMSFAGLAQAQRHRTIHYEMEFDGTKEYGCYIPPILDSKLAEEWVNDFNLIKDKFPQCTLVRVIEYGTVSNLMYKAAERLCGRAQLEIANNTTKLMEQVIMNKDKMSKSLQTLVDNYIDNNKVCAKCRMNEFKCTEPCIWGANQALTRLI